MSLKNVYLYWDDVRTLKRELEPQGLQLRDVLGGKGAGLMLMTNAGLPVPPGLTIPTHVCNQYFREGERLPPGLWDDVKAAISELEQRTQKRFGDCTNPLLVAVRSGAKYSLPGMLDTALNLGMNDAIAHALARQTGNPWFAWDAYRRFVMMFGNVVMGVDRSRFEACLEERKAHLGIEKDTEVPAEDMQQVVTAQKHVYQQELGHPLPTSGEEQLMAAVEAVFRSWNNERAIAFRNKDRIPHNIGTAVNIQTMVFGNMGWDSGTGVAFTRDPADGSKRLTGDFLPNAQGEDVVGGVRKSVPLFMIRGLAHLSSDDRARYDSLPRDRRREIDLALEPITARLLPGWVRVADEFDAVASRLEGFFHNTQDIEFTVERGTLWILQTRNAKRTGVAGVKIAVDMVDEGLVSIEQALLQVEAETLPHLLVAQLDPADRLAHRNDLLATATGASPGVGAGKIVFTSGEAQAATRENHRRLERGEPIERVLLVRQETSPDDIAGMQVSQGILTVTGGMASHAAVVGRQMGKPVVVGCGDLLLDEAQGQLFLQGRVFRRGDVLTIDGATGEVYGADVRTVPSEVAQVLQGTLPGTQCGTWPYYQRFMAWVEQRRLLQVRANADRPDTAREGLIRGARGIGLCRTEHLFFQHDRLEDFQTMILAETQAERTRAAEVLRSHQRQDFREILEIMDGKPVIIRLLDPPLHEFLPKEDEHWDSLSRRVGKPVEDLRRIARQLYEQNPMLGHRGCRLGITFPEIYRMQARAIFEAAADLKRRGRDPQPEVMIPLVSVPAELEQTAREVRAVADQVFASVDGIRYQLGTMIEVPRACLVAADIAPLADFFSFGTNDLTQCTFAFSRDDVEAKFLPDYLRRGVLQVNPFVVLDRCGVGRLIEMALREGRAANPRLEVGLCGQHGGDPQSIQICHDLGMDYISCDPPLVPVALLAAAQAQIRRPR